MTLLLAHGDLTGYYVAYGAAGALFVFSGVIVIGVGRVLVAVLRPARTRQTLGVGAERRRGETLEAGLWALAGILFWYWLASALIAQLEIAW